MMKMYDKFTFSKGLMVMGETTGLNFIANKGLPEPNNIVLDEVVTDILKC